MRANINLVAGLLILVGFSAILPVEASAVPTVQATLVRVTETSKFTPPSPDPCGVVYLPDYNSLLISDSEVEEMPPYWTGKNLFQVTLSGTLISTLTTAPFSDEPTGVAYDPVSKNFFFTDDDWGRVFILNPGPDRIYNTADDIVTYFSTRAFGSQDTEDVVFDSVRGHLLVVDGEGTEVYDISPGANGIFDGIPPAGDDVVTHFDTAAIGISDPEGIAFNPDNSHLYILGSNGRIAETTIDGILLRYIDVSINLGAGGGMTYGPASNDPAQRSIYIVARGVDNGANPNENDGKLYEISFPPFDSSVPTATVLSPSSAAAGGLGFTLTVDGTNFVNGSVVRWNWTDRPTTYVSPTQLTASISQADIATAGTASVTVFSPAPGGGTSNAQTFLINFPVPTLTSLSPSTAVAGGAAFTLAVSGTNFVSGSVVRWNGADRPTTYVSSTQLTASILASDIVASGIANLTVFNPAPGGGTSAALAFAITSSNPLPAVASLNPSYASVKGTAFTLTVTGSNFVNGAVVRWNGSNRTTTFISSAELRASIKSSDISSGGINKVTVFNPAPGGGLSNTVTFEVRFPVPTITSLSPASATAGGAAFTLTVYGKDFQKWSWVKWNGSGTTTTYVSDSQLTVLIDARDIRVPGTATVTVVNPSPGGGPSNAAIFTIEPP